LRHGGTVHLNCFLVCLNQLAIFDYITIFVSFCLFFSILFFPFLSLLLYLSIFFFIFLSFLLYLFISFFLSFFLSFSFFLLSFFFLFLLFFLFISLLLSLFLCLFIIIVLFMFFSLFWIFKQVFFYIGSRNYTAAVDMWAVGCIFAELLNHGFFYSHSRISTLPSLFLYQFHKLNSRVFYFLGPLFPGEHDIDQLSRVFSSFCISAYLLSFFTTNNQQYFLGIPTFGYSYRCGIVPTVNCLPIWNTNSGLDMALARLSSRL
jgi:serine/threonine protein kinase